MVDRLFLTGVNPRRLVAVLEPLVRRQLDELADLDLPLPARRPAERRRA
jgi:hypothetical protein